MAEVTIDIKGKQYDIACDDGQERRVADLARYIDRKIQTISKSGAAKNEAHLMVLAALVLTDELFEAKEQVEYLSQQAPEAKPAANDTVIECDKELVDKLQLLTQRIEDITSILDDAA